MLSDIQIQEIEQSLNVTLILQSEDMIVFVENETEKQVVLNFAEIVKETLNTKLHGNAYINAGEYSYNIRFTNGNSSTTYTWGT